MAEQEAGGAPIQIVSSVQIKPKQFSGIGDLDIVEWIRDYEFISQANGWDDNLKIQKLPAFLYARNITDQ